MQNQPPLQVLSFGASDPLGATGIQADLASFAAMGCHGLSVITAILVSDTTQITQMEPIDAEIVIEQARTILEDVPVTTFKIGTLGSIENVTAIAEIVSDYPDIPLIFDPFSSYIAHQEEETDDIFVAMNELIIPQTTLFVASAMEIARLAESWREPSDIDMLAADVQQLIRSGCQYVFVMGNHLSNNEITNYLYDETGAIREDKWPRLNGPFLGSGATFSGAVTALIANGITISEAILEAQEFTNAALTHAQRFGMGKLIPDRYFWTRDPDEADDSDAEPASNPTSRPTSD